MTTGRGRGKYGSANIGIFTLDPVDACYMATKMYPKEAEARRYMMILKHLSISSGSLLANVRFWYMRSSCVKRFILME